MKKIAAPHVQNLLDYAESLGADIVTIKDKCLNNPAGDLGKIENKVSMIEHGNIIRELAEFTADSYLGLHYGCFLNIKSMGLIYNISKSATEANQVIDFLNDFLVSTFPVIEIKIVNSKKRTELRLLCEIKDEFISKHLLDSTLAIMYRESRLIFGNKIPIKVFIPTVDLEPYNNALDVKAGRGRFYTIQFDSSLMNKALSRNTIFSLNEMLPAFLNLLESAKSSDLFSSQVKRMILNMATPDLPDLKKVADQFCMSERTMQRRLLSENTTFRTIINTITKDLAKYLKKSKHLKIRDIAQLLGYSEASAYLHAVSKW